MSPTPVRRVPVMPVRVYPPVRARQIDEQKVVKVICRPMPELLLGVVFNPCHGRDVSVLVGVRGVAVLRC